METGNEWSLSGPRTLDLAGPVDRVNVRIVGGTVDVVGTDADSTRLEVGSVEGPPLTVTHEDGALTVTYDDLPWKGFLKWLDPKGRRRSAAVSLAVPAGARVEVGVVGAGAVVSGIEGPAHICGVTGDTTLVGLTGDVRAETVSGGVDAQGLTGRLTFASVSGDLTVIEAYGSAVRAESVSGNMIVDVDGRTADLALSTVSGEIAIRIPHPADARVEASTASGAVSNAFEELKVTGQWGTKQLTGTLGEGSGRLKASTVSGAIALLRRPRTEDEPPYGEGEGPQTDSPANSGKVL
ncbi:DUF4097 family beta strand repeat-containing protein [Streptomyces sp. NPDC047108]|uniref:DUF4097 family beta strand repeat-containing protein n=1 Tax=Streptomyces sp. NPDC047108 TaxID=3155025 RepID=UPI0033E439CA